MDPLNLTAQEFRRLAGRITDLSSDFLTSLDGRPIFPKTSGAEVERLFSTPLPESGMGAEALTALQDVIAHSRAQNGRFFGYVQGPGEPVAALGDLMASILNQNMTAWRSSPAGITIEKTVVRWLAEALGCAGFVGTLTSGGSAANLMGLTMAREAKIPSNERGLRSTPPSAIYASEQVHMAVPRAVAMIGVGRENLRYIPCDASYRMIPSELELALQRDRAEGVTPIAVVASAGTVMERWRQLQFLKNLTGWRWPIRSLSIRISGSISHSTADVSSIATSR